MPARMAFTVDREKDRVQMPLVSGFGAPATELIRIGLAKFATPLANGFVRHADSPDKEQLFHIAVAPTKAEVEPDAMTDDLNREAVIFIAVGWSWCIHTTSMAHRNDLNKLTKPSVWLRGASGVVGGRLSE
jgi:hypothetical protein